MYIFLVVVIFFLIGSINSSLHSNNRELLQNDDPCKATQCAAWQRCFAKGKSAKCVTRCDVACPNDKDCKDTNKGAVCSSVYDPCMSMSSMCPKDTMCVAENHHALCQIPVKCGGSTDIKCPNGYVCQDDTSDRCDPECGGKNCNGFCVKRHKNKNMICNVNNKMCEIGYKCYDDASDDCNSCSGKKDCPGYCGKLLLERPPQCMCNNDNKPVCCNGQNYNNLCFAYCENAKNCINGRCTATNNNNNQKTTTMAPTKRTTTAEPIKKTTTLEPIKCVCTEEYKPVCCDGKEYSNQCNARCEKATNCVQGKCVSCGGRRNVKCTAANAICQDIPSDSCDPECGGRNCNGFCVMPVNGNPTCGGLTGSRCRRGVCYESNDGCNVKCGGADCGGYCGVAQTTPQ